MAEAPPPNGSGRTFIYDGLAQNDLDMAYHRLLNLDTSNLPELAAPPSIHPPGNEWLQSWDNPTHQWTTKRPGFVDLSGGLTTGSGGQQQDIREVGIIRIGVWQATPLGADRVPTLDLIRSPVGNVSLTGKRLTNVANPVDPGDAINLAFLDSMLQGLQPKAAVRAASTGHIFEPLAGFLVIDGVQLVPNDRVLVKDQFQTVGYVRGIYRVIDEGPWQREPDFDGVPDDHELRAAYVFVLEGARNAFTSWVQVTPSPILLVSDSDPGNPHAPNFQLFSSSANSAVVPGSGLSADGNTLNVGGTPGRIAVNPDSVDIDPAYAGQTSIDTLGNIINGTWNGDLISGTRGGTGVNNTGKTITISGNVLVVDALDAINVRDLVPRLSADTNLLLPTVGVVATTNAPETFTNKRTVRRVDKIASSAKPAINVDNVDVFGITALGEAISSMSDNLTGTPTDRQELEIWMKDNGIGVVKTIAWGSKWTASSDLPLPTVFTGTGWLFMKFVYAIELTKWVLTQKLFNIS